MFSFNKRQLVERLKDFKKIVIVVLVLLFFNLFFAYKYFTFKKYFYELASSPDGQINEDVLNFTKFFVDNVLKTDKEVSLESRLKMESDIKKINNPEIIQKWENFVNSQTEDEAQKNVRELLKVLIEKIKK
ncbi:MAG: hypothetical protein NC935_03765 [Candidatus Omnitrophica bacterium]|nr:hypothetical protein [Candidatus Omnitrophota bacterium]